MISENPNWENAGIFSERATGLKLKERTEFHRMISKCRKKEVDLILTKSISRFGRNTLDMLQALQELCSLEVDIYFEQEICIWVDSRFKCCSSFIVPMRKQRARKWAGTSNGESDRGLKMGLRAMLNSSFGVTSVGQWAPCNRWTGCSNCPANIWDESKLVRSWIDCRLAVWKVDSFPRWKITLESWNHQQVAAEWKVCRNVLQQKTFAEDLFSGKQRKNKGELEKFLIQKHHPAIVSRELFETVNQTM